MGAILGSVSNKDQSGAESRWSESIASLRTATNEALSVPAFATSPSQINLAYVGDFFRNSEVAVWLDGRIMNLPELIQRPHGSSVIESAAAIAELFSREGVSVFSRLEGVYAIVVIVIATQEVHLVRDRLGAKSLYFAQVGDGWAWSSEVKGLARLQEHRSIDLNALSESIHYRFLVGDRTLVVGIWQVMPACFVTIRPGTSPSEVQYWDLRIRPETSVEPLGTYVDRLDAILDRHFERLRTRYDEIGLFLSGGVDSSLLAHKAKQFDFRRCLALTAKWNGENPELQWAERVASHLGLEHRIVSISDHHIERRFPWLVYRMEQPPRHYNAFALDVLFEAAGTEVPVIVHGEAADALFGQHKMHLIRRVARFHRNLRFVPKSWQRYTSRRMDRYGALSKVSRRGRIASYLLHDTESYLFLINQIDHRGLGRVFRRGNDPRCAVNQRFRELFYDSEAPWVERMQQQNLYSMVNSALNHVDRLATPYGMGISLPFLARESIELASSLPYELKVADAEVKPVVKELARRWFPKDWINRKKQGFPTPLAQWLAGPLSRWQGILAEERTRARGIIDADVLLSADRHISSETLWTAMTLELALRQIVDGDGWPCEIPNLRTDLGMN